MTSSPSPHSHASQCEARSKHRECLLQSFASIVSRYGSFSDLLLHYAGRVIASVAAGNEEDINCAEAAAALLLLLLLLLKVDASSCPLYHCADSDKQRTAGGAELSPSAALILMCRANLEENHRK